MRRTALLLVFAVVAGGCGDVAPQQPVRVPKRAEPRQAELGWRELYPAGQKERLVFSVDAFDVTAEGWTARIAVRNETRTPFEAGKRPAELEYGLMLFATGDQGAFEDAAKTGGLPAVRKAVAIEPRPPAVLRPGATWRATLTAPGALPSGAHARVVFGPLRAVSDPPEGTDPVVVWITDRSHRL